MTLTKMLTDHKCNPMSRGDAAKSAGPGFAGHDYHNWPVRGLQTAHDVGVLQGGLHSYYVSGITRHLTQICAQWKVLKMLRVDCYHDGLALGHVHWLPNVGSLGLELISGP